MAELQRALIDAGHSRQYMIAGPGSELVLKGRVIARWAISHAILDGTSCSDQIGEVTGRFGETVEVIRDGEVLNDVAFPGVDNTAIGLEPVGHSAPPWRIVAAVPSGWSFAFFKSRHPVAVLWIQPP